MRTRSLSALVACLLTAGCTGTAARHPVAGPSTSRSAPVVAPGTPSPTAALPTTAPPTTAPSRAVGAPRTTTPAQPPAKPGLVWVQSRVPAGLVRAANRLGPATSVVEVANGTVWLREAPGSPLAAPIDVSAADPRRYARALPAAGSAMSGLVAGQVLLASDEAGLRRLRVGSRLTLAGVPLRVKGIVADALIGRAEMFVTASDGRRLGLPPDRFLLVRPQAPRAWSAVAAALRKATPSGTPVRILAPGKARVLREADAVLTPLEEKLRFGEFAAAAQVGGGLSIDPRWLAAHITTADVPILGAVTCNKAFLPMLRKALDELVRQGLQRLVDPADFGGCFNARLIAGQPGASISHHAYGSALDLNVSANPQGRPSAQDRRLVRIFARFGLTWGGGWLVPDGMHFEALGGPVGLP
ncbi:MAG: hypothetical protein QOJ83_713 [Frankiales bacterium]|nr:hypothetical protein [Frankiales bacterium]